MKNLELLASALEYAEMHLQEEICTEDIANACYCSKSTIEKLFRCVNHISVRDYLIRRRMTVAARLLLEHPEENILDIGLACGYSTPESFCRAFQQIWNSSPSAFRKKGQTAELFPRMVLPLENGDVYMAERRNFDISELYDLFRSRKDCYFVCSDIVRLVPINEISHKAGDLAILESMKRMEEAAGEEDVVFRIGGDEFAMLTNSGEIQYAEEIVNKIISQNDKTFDYEGQEIPLSLHVAVVKMNLKIMKYDELFTGLHSALRENRNV